MASSLLTRLDAGDRALFVRWALTTSTPGTARAFWRAVTSAGGATATLAASVVPLWLDGALHEAAKRALLVLLASHLMVQGIKRSVGRPRPSRGLSCTTLIAEPDRFSFPSGHAAAAMAVALGYASVFPSWAPALVGIAVVVGCSRVALGVHYPGDVLVGQSLALASAAALAMW